MPGRDRDQPEEPYYPEPGKDLVLGLPALLGVFFSIALICAVCFGIGYSSGHGFHFSAQPAAATVPAAPVAAPMPAPAASLPEPNAESKQPEEDPGQNAWPPSSPTGAEVPAPSRVADKPAPGLDLPAARTSTSPATDDQLSMPPASRNSVLSRQMVNPRNRQAVAPAASVGEAAGVSSPVANATPGLVSGLVPTQTVRTFPATKAPMGTPPTPAARPNAEGEAMDTGAGLMVQIAAVSRAADAQTLATALRHDGFAALVRTGLNDPLFHVQVGPFPSLEAAKAMRARLAGNGYNAFIKP